VNLSLAFERKAIMTIWISTVLFLTASADRNKQEQIAHSHSWLMDRIENLVRLPAAAQPMKVYLRVYAPLTQRNVGWAWATRPKLDGPKVIGVYTTLGPGTGQRWSDDFPMVDDGGCALITVIYDVRQDRIESANCNGPG
jgi:hypothetical protein